ncbi:16S rRNA (cytidine(1402)-2'-O)-methyltransferase [Roseobacteraceae bacterium S113]
MGGRLTFVAVPIGNARDITLRALDVLGQADVLAAEDTRSLKRLMEIHGVPLRDRRIQAYHEHNGARARPALLAALDAGQHVAYASEAGTPLVSDPGFDLARAAADAGHEVQAAPGASAVLTALNVAGLPTDRFFFAGFLPSSKSARRKGLTEVADVPATLVFYESPHRISAMLRDAFDILGPRQAALCRELTKKFEEVRRGTLDALAASVDERPVKGEIVMVIERAPQRQSAPEDIEAALRDALQTMSLRDAAAHVAAQLGANKRSVYSLGLDLRKASDDE